MDQQYSQFATESDEIGFDADMKREIVKFMQFLDTIGLLAAETFEDNYEVIEISGGGSEGTVFKVRDKNSKNEIKALKRRKFHVTDKCNFGKEIRNMIEINHKNVAKVEKVSFEYNPKEFEAIINIVMPFCDETLLSWLTKEKDPIRKGIGISSNKRTFEEVQNMFISILHGIVAIHSKNIIHNDLKFGNTLVAPIQHNPNNSADSRLEGIITDFGGGKNLANPNMSSSLLCTTVAPEINDYAMKKGSGEKYEMSDFFSPKVDIFQFGAMLFRIFIREDWKYSPVLVTSEAIKIRIRQIFENDNIPDTVILELESILKSCLATDPKDRPSAIGLFGYEFFNKNLTIELENQYLIALNHLEGKNGFAKDYKKSRAILEHLSIVFDHMPARFFFGFILYHGLGTTMDEKSGDKIMSSCSKAAIVYFESTDDPLGFSAFAIAYMHFLGFGGPKDYLKSFEFAMRSAEKGNSFAQLTLGNIHKLGQGIPTNYSEALKYFKLSSAQGNAGAHNNLGLMHKDGLGTPINHEEAAKYFKLAVDDGSSTALFNLGMLCLEGKGVEKNIAEGLRYIHLAADKGYALAQFELACVFYNGCPQEKRNYSQAHRYYKLAADQGHVDAQIDLAVMSMRGTGEIAIDYSEAVKYYKMAADQGSFVGQHLLAHMLFEGFGCQKNRSEAFKYFKLAADQGEPNCQLALGIMFQHGYGTEKDVKQAIKYCKLAADQGLGGAQHHYASILANGEGTEKDQEEAVNPLRPEKF